MLEIMSNNICCYEEENVNRIEYYSGKENISNLPQKDDVAASVVYLYISQK